MEYKKEDIQKLIPHDYRCPVWKDPVMQYTKAASKIRE